MKPDPMARRIRSLRSARGETLDMLANSASRLLAHAPAELRSSKRRASVSTSYLSLIENGHKVPDAQVAWALARALDDDPEIYAAWVRTRKGADFGSALAAAEMLKHKLMESHSSIPRRPEPGPASAARSRRRRPQMRGGEGSAPARLRLPIIPEGTDPGEGVRPSCTILEWRGVRSSDLPTEWLDRLDRPFGFRLSEAGTRRAPDVLFAGDYAMVLRDFGALSPPEVYAVRHDGLVILSRVLWNGEALLLLPAHGASDFMVISGCDEQRLHDLVLGTVFTLGVV